MTENDKTHGTSFVDKLFRLKAPFDREQLLEIRRNILETMKEKTFDHYMAQMHFIRDASVKIVANVHSRMMTCIGNKWNCLKNHIG